jgi:hypothetical protein
MEKRGLLERKSDPLDGRKALFALTEAGRTLDVPSPGTVEAAVQRAISRMSRARIVGAQDVLTALAEELGSGDPSDHPNGNGPKEGVDEPVVLKADDDEAGASRKTASR